MKPALTQPWGLTDVPEHLIWAFWWPMEPFPPPPKACEHPGVLENIIPSCVFVRFTYLSWLNVSLKNEQVAHVITTSAQALLRFSPSLRVTRRSTTCLGPACWNVDIPLYHFFYIYFFHQVQKWTWFIQKWMKLFDTSLLICNLRCSRTDLGEPAL